MTPWRNTLAIVPLLAGSFARGDDLYPVTGDSDFAVYNDRFFDSSRNSTRSGFFNRDGFVDLLIGEGEGKSHIVLLGPPGENRQTSADGVFLLKAPAGSECIVGDLNNDTIDDRMILHPLARRVSIVYGKDGATGELDLNVLAADVELTIPRPGFFCGFAVGRFNSDDSPDLAVVTNEGTAPTLCRLFFGPSALPNGTHDVRDLTAQSILDYSNLTVANPDVRSKDINGDGLDDLMITRAYDSRHRDPDGLLSAEAHLFLGRARWPTTWDVSTTPPDFILRGAGGSDFLPLEGPGIGDFTGDGLGEVFLLYRYNLDPVRPVKLLMVDGSFLALSTPVVVNIHYDAPGPARSTVVFPDNTGVNSIGLGDFDGDGREDLFVEGSASRTDAAISSDYPVGFPLQISTPSIVVHMGKSPHLRDLNRDGRADLMVRVTGVFETPGGFANDAIMGFYGFRPLRRPWATVTRNADVGWVDVALGVDEGDPTEMRFSGDVESSLRNRWIPLRSPYRLALDPESGIKTVHVTFRNAYKRASDPVSFQTSTRVESAGIAAVTNRIHPGQTARWDLRVPHPAPVRAKVFLTTGEPVAVLYEGEGGPGVVPLTWNGQNDGGHPVAPGVYVLVADVDGRSFKTTVLVR